jgi:hypothetical protein
MLAIGVKNGHRAVMCRWSRMAHGATSPDTQPARQLVLNNVRRCLAFGKAMRRRDLIKLMGGAAAWPLSASAQEPGKVRYLGYLSPAASHNHVDDAFEEELQQLGWTQGH